MEKPANKRLSENEINILFPYPVTFGLGHKIQYTAPDYPISCRKPYPKPFCGNLCRDISLLSFLKYVRKHPGRSNLYAKSFCFRLLLLYIIMKLLDQQHFYLMVILSRCQISSTYSWMVRSEVNLPLHAVFKRAIFAHLFSSLYAASTFLKCKC